MDGIHDLGGLQGFGPIHREASEPVFHAAWEARMFALASAVPFAVAYGDDHFRPAIEAMEPAHYLRSSYYEKWYVAVARLLRDSGAVSEAELSGRAPPTRGAANPIRAAAVAAAIAAGASQARPDAGVGGRFKAGDWVTTRRHMPARHTRLPTYARGKPARIECLQGAFLVADQNAVGQPRPEMLYTVVFDSRALWGPEAAAGDCLSLDLWDSYLEPGAGERSA